jgi:hypothetical protein
MLLYKSGWFNWLFKLMRPVGQMAFTNYLMQSLMCAIYFYGFGFGKYGQLQRYEIYYVVAGHLGALNNMEPYLAALFPLGPLEWLWRSLTYWHLQPMKKILHLKVVAESNVNPSFQASVIYAKKNLSAKSAGERSPVVLQMKVFEGYSTTKQHRFLFPQYFFSQL